MDQSNRRELTLEFLTQHKGRESSSVKRLFESYGCNTLEAYVPVITDPVAEKITGFNREARDYAALALKAESASMALEGRHPRTRNRELKTVQVAGEIFISAGKIRERSPIDIKAMENDLDQYMKEASRIRAANLAGLASTASMDVDMDENKQRSIGSPPSVARIQNSSTSSLSNNKNNKKSLPDVETLDDELEAYMREASRKRRQAKKLAEQNEQSAVMEKFESLACAETAVPDLDIKTAIDVDDPTVIANDNNAVVAVGNIPQQDDILDYELDYGDDDDDL